MDPKELTAMLDKKITFTMNLRMIAKCNCVSLLSYELNKYARDEVKVSLDGEVTVFTFTVRNRLVVSSVLNFLDSRLKEFNLSDIFIYVDANVNSVVSPVVTLTLNKDGWSEVNCK